MGPSARTTSPGPRSYLVRWLAATLLLVLAVGAFNVVVDPYGIFRVVDTPGFNAIKPTATTRGGMAKAYGVQREHPGALVLGNSRAEVGFDPHHAAWPEAARPVFNLSIAGTGPATTLRYFQHALAAADAAGRPIRVVVWGIDFMDFLVRDDVVASAPPVTADEQRLLGGQPTKPALAAAWQRMRDVGESSLTMRAFTDAVQTLAAQRDPMSMDQTPLGFNPMRDYLRIARDEGYRSIFQQKNATYVRSFRFRPTSLFDARGTSSHELDALRRVMQLCRERSIALHLVMYPYHAHFQEAIRLTGHAPALQAWKRLMVQTVADEARTSGRAPVPLWDFAGFNAWTTEAVPPRGDRRTAMQWYWEAGHFKRELGDMVLDQVLGLRPADPALGVLLDAGNIDARLEEQQALQDAYRQQHADDVRELERLAR
jgi:hypothetical protein